MNISRCPRCENTFFEFVVGNLTNADYSYSFAQCNKCKTVVGVVEFEHSGTAISHLSGKVDALGQKIENLRSEIASIKNMLGKII